MADAKGCPKCGAKNPPGYNFCEQCGAKLPSGGAPKEKPSRTSASPRAPRPEPPTPPLSEPSSERAGGRPSAGFLATAAVLLFVVFTRFDHLGAKPHHHDESMHAYYSYRLFTEGDYEYNPMMHGPFQFHGNAVMYFLFGVSDATSRYLAAFFGVGTVLLALAMRPFLGRAGAFLAFLLLAASPSAMYFARFTREDAYIAGATLAFVLFLWRYGRSHEPREMWLAALAFAVAFCTKESIFITVAVLGTYLFIRLQPWFDVFVAAALTLSGLASTLVIAKGNSARYPVLFLFLAAALGYTLVKLFLRWRQNIREGPESPLWRDVCSLEFEKVKWELTAAAAWWILTIAVLRAPSLQALNRPGVLSLLFVISYLAVLCRFGWLWIRGRAPVLSGAITVFGIVFTLLFTTFFTVGSAQATFLGRLHGLWNALYNGAFGGLEYWWDQHDVRRGDQPWYYYLVQLPANEAVSYFLGLLAIAYYAALPAALRAWAFLRPEAADSSFHRRYAEFRTLPLFLVYWYVGTLVLFSWAGEKMPWLVLHPLLPTLLLAALLLGEVWESRPAHQAGRALRAAVLGVAGILFAYSVHSAVLLCFHHEANPVEPLVYVQSGPDTKEVVRLIEEISYGETGGQNLPLTIEDKCSWPFAWYLRGFPNRGHPTNIQRADNPVILTATETDERHYPLLSEAGYVNRKYKLRVWWVPSWFKKGQPHRPLTAGLFWDWLWGNFLPFGSPRPDMVDLNDLKDWILYRKVWSDLGSYNMRLWVRGDLAAKYGFTETTRADVPASFPRPKQP